MGMLRKLGKLSPRFDPRSLKLDRYLKVSALPALRDAVINSAAVKQAWGAMLNDSIGDCTCAGFGHIVMLISAAMGKLVVPPDSEILSMYETIGGYKPGDASTDNGAVELDALKFMRNVGLSGVKLDAFADIEPDNRDYIKYSIQLFGSCYIGVSMPQSAMDASDNGELWANVSDTNIIGGHAIPLVDFDEQGPTCITWGQLQKMTWPWFEKYCDEAHAPLFLAGFPPSGFDVPALEADLKVVTA